MRSLLRRFQLGLFAATCLTITAPSQAGDPFAKSEPRPLKDPYAGKSASCDLPDARHIALHVLEASAAKHECAAQYMLPVGGAVPVGGPAPNFSNPNQFSRKCGAVMHAALDAGQLHYSQRPHAIEVVIAEGNQERPVFSGTITGQTLSSTDETKALLSANSQFLQIPNAYTEGTVVVRFSNPTEMRTPAPSGIGERLNEINRACRVMVFTAIDASGPWD